MRSVAQWIVDVFNIIHVGNWTVKFPVLVMILAKLLKLIDFSLYDILWIQRIQWIMTKSKSSMVTRDILYLTIDTFLDVVIKRNFPLLSVIWYLFRVVSGNKYLLRGGNGNTLCITKIGNVFVARWVIPYYFWILSWFTEFAEFTECQFGKTQMCY